MIVPLGEADERCGGKALSLGRLLRAGFSVPDGFVIPDPADDGWAPRLDRALTALGSATFAVRSSAIDEDGAGTSFAGQLHTTLDVSTAADVEAAARRTAASASVAPAVAYAARSGLEPLTGAVPVIVQAMVRPEAAGVLFTRHPVTGGDQIVVEAVAGRGDAVVDGIVTPDRWVVDDGVVTGPMAPRRASLTPRQVRELGELGRRIETLLGSPQDVEWAIADGRCWVLQARPITTLGGGRDASTAATIAGDLLVTGTPASPGLASGPANVVLGLDDFKQFAEGDVLVCHTTSPAWTPLLARAAAVVTETGGILAHAAIVAREFGIPAVLAAHDATTVLAGGRAVVVDGSRGLVTAGVGRGANR